MCGRISKSVKLTERFGQCRITIRQHFPASYYHSTVNVVLVCPRTSSWGLIYFFTSFLFAFLTLCASCRRPRTRSADIFWCSFSQPIRLGSGTHKLLGCGRHTIGRHGLIPPCSLAAAHRDERSHSVPFARRQQQNWMTTVTAIVMTGDCFSAWRHLAGKWCVFYILIYPS